MACAGLYNIEDAFKKLIKILDTSLYIKTKKIYINMSLEMFVFRIIIEKVNL